MKSLFLKLSTALLSVTFLFSAGCIKVPESATNLEGSLDTDNTSVPYDKLALNMFPRNQTAGDTLSQMLDIRSLGINRIRVNFWFDTSYMTFSSSVPDFRKFDDVVNSAGSAGVEIVGILAYVPGWLVGDPNWKNVYINNFVIPVVARYAGQVHYWEIWNEPDEITFSVLDGSAEDYFSLLQMASDAIRLIDPSARIVSAASVNIVADGIAKFEWTNQLIDMGLSRYADILNIHTYGGQYEELIILGVPMVLKANMPLWITEFGKRGHGNQLAYFEDTMKKLELILSPDRIYWYTYIESAVADETRSADSTYGLVTMDGGSRQESELYTHLKNR